LHSGEAKTPVFVAQRLNRQMLVQGQGMGRTDRFYAEARLPQAERAELADYRGSGYDRGHMAPAGDMHNDEAMAQSFSLANMVPQDPTHNRGAWAKIEADTRKYVMRAQGDVYVFTGPVYEGAPAAIGEGRVAVPSHLYKVVYDASTGRSWVHWHANNVETKAGPPISYDEFVRHSGLRLLLAAKR
jgi:endonuclease G